MHKDLFTSAFKDSKTLSRAILLSKGMTLACPGASLEDLPKIVAERVNAHPKTGVRWIKRWLLNAPPVRDKEGKSRIWSEIEAIAKVGECLTPKKEPSA